MIQDCVLQIIKVRHTLRFHYIVYDNGNEDYPMENFKNRKLEVLIFPTEEQEPEKTDIASVVQSLIGAIPATGLSLAEMQEENDMAFDAERS